MRIVINGKTAVLKKGTSFDFVAENRAFSGSDSYSLSITFPLRGCPENIAIFGNLNRTDLDNSKLIFDCVISDVDFYCVGSLTITEITESDIKSQFFEGRTAQNFNDSFDNIFINELDLGYAKEITPANNMADMWKPYPEREFVALPWINSETGTMYNEVVKSEGKYEFAYSTSNYVSAQPYLIVIVKKIFEAVGYSYNFDAWENSMAKYLLICNSLPVGYDYMPYANLLPHWSLTEFIEELEKILDCEINVNHNDKNVSMNFSIDIYANIKEVKIDTVIKEFSCEVSQDAIASYEGEVYYCYKERGDDLWKIEDCPWYIDYLHNLPYGSWLSDPIEEFETFDDLLNEVSKDKWRDYNGAISAILKKVYYAKDFKQYYILKVLYSELMTSPDRRRWHFALIPINTFGNINITKENEDLITTEEMAIVPVRIESTLVENPEGGVLSDKGRCMYLPCQYLDSGYTTSSGTESYIYQQIIAGKSETKEACYDTIYVGYWDGETLDTYPYPYLDKITVGENWLIHKKDFPSLNPKKRSEFKYHIQNKQKYKFSFLSNTLPNPRDIFYINGKKYLCEKIAATITENGMSQLKKGEFYRIIN